MNFSFADRVSAMEVSGVRKVFDLARQIENPVNLSIGQPHFDVPEDIRKAAADAINSGKNAYTQTQGGPELRKAILNSNLGKDYNEKELLVVSGVSGALTLAFLALLNPGDEIVTTDPYFVSYKQLSLLCGATPVYVDTYPDFKLKAEAVEGKITDKTKCIVISSPSNPTGVVYSEEELKALAAVAEKHDLLVISDEIYADFVYDDELPRIKDYYKKTLVMGGFSKSHAMTGWRLGYVLGNEELIGAMTKLQQFTYVCAPSFAQFAAALAVDNPLQEEVADYKCKRDKIYNGLKDIGYEVECPGGAFYIFPKVPWGTDMEFVEEAVKNKLLIIPGSVFSEKNTHFRISYAAADDVLDQGLEILESIFKK
ncbi:MAG: pyridoxal phosphate-dependent aminotransferase [Planctomycetota bacterium]|jgi:aspartate aminotransferase/aminotransferase